MSTEVPPGGATILGKYVREGICIGYSAWALYRKKRHSAPTSISYDQRDGLTGDNVEPRLADMNKTVDPVFGYGKNACLGKPIAQMETRKTIAELLRRFDRGIVKPEKPFNSVNRNGLFIHDAMFMRFERRNK